MSAPACGYDVLTPFQIQLQTRRRQLHHQVGRRPKNSRGCQCRYVGPDGCGVLCFGQHGETARYVGNHRCGRLGRSHSRSWPLHFYQGCDGASSEPSLPGLHEPFLCRWAPRPAAVRVPEDSEGPCPRKRDRHELPSALPLAAFGQQPPPINPPRTSTKRSGFELARPGKPGLPEPVPWVNGRCLEYGQLDRVVSVDA